MPERSQFRTIMVIRWLLSNNTEYDTTITSTYYRLPPPTPNKTLQCTNQYQSKPISRFRNECRAERSSIVFTVRNVHIDCENTTTNTIPIVVAERACDDRWWSSLNHNAFRSESCRWCERAREQSARERSGAKCRKECRLPTMCDVPVANVSIIRCSCYSRSRGM